YLIKPLREYFRISSPQTGVRSCSPGISNPSFSYQLVSFRTQRSPRFLMDKTIVCRDCGTNFTFTEGEQTFFSSKGYTEPQRCADCRASKKASRGSDSYGSGGGYSSAG